MRAAEFRMDRLCLPQATAVWHGILAWTLPRLWDGPMRRPRLRRLAR